MTKRTASKKPAFGGYAISFRRYHRAEYTVPAKDIRVLRIKETSIE